jgi:drug/metabolite transporter (DMT)-like permease
VLQAVTVDNPQTWKDELHALVFVGMFMVGSSMFYIGGVKTTTKTGVATIIGFIGTVTAYVISIFRYGEIPNFIAILGSITIFIGLVLVLLK